MSLKTLKNHNQKGQALILLLLILAAALTVVLSAVSRSVTEVTVSTSEENSLRAFSAAEAGIEDKLLNPQVAAPATVAVDSSTSYTVEVRNNPESDRAFRYPKELLGGETATFWLISHDATGRLTQPGFTGPQIDICWGKDPLPPAAERPAIEVMLFYDDNDPPGPPPPPSSADPNNFVSVKVARVAYDAAGRGNFSSSVSYPSSCVIDGQDFLYHRNNIFGGPVVPCTLPGGCQLMAVVRMSYNGSTPQPVGIRVTGGNGFLPPQGFLIESTGTSGESRRRINVFQSYPEIPNLFEAAVFSEAGLLK